MKTRIFTLVAFVLFIASCKKDDTASKASAGDPIAGTYSFQYVGASSSGTCRISSTKVGEGYIVGGGMDLGVADSVPITIDGDKISLLYDTPAHTWYGGNIDYSGLGTYKNGVITFAYTAVYYGGSLNSTVGRNVVFTRK